MSRARRSKGDPGRNALPTVELYATTATSLEQKRRWKLSLTPIKAGSERQLEIDDVRLRTIPIKRATTRPKTFKLAKQL